MKNFFTAVCALVLATSAHALYDPKPLSEAQALVGEWGGTLTYNDYANPGKLVTLQTTLATSLSAPNEVILHYVFDDGPSKTVYSYETLRFDMEKNEVIWISGAPRKPANVHRIVSRKTDGGASTIVFERVGEKAIARYTLEIKSSAFSFLNEEVNAKGEASFRNRYAFTRKARAP